MRLKPTNMGESGVGMDMSEADSNVGEQQFSLSHLQKAVTDLGHGYNDLVEHSSKWESRFAEVDRLEQLEKRFAQFEQEFARSQRDGDDASGRAAHVAGKKQIPDNNADMLKHLSDRHDALRQVVRGVRADQLEIQHFTNRQDRGLKLVGTVADNIQGGMTEIKEAQDELVKRFEKCERDLANLSPARSHEPSEDMEDVVEQLCAELSDAVGGVDIRKWMTRLAARVVKMEATLSSLLQSASPTSATTSTSSSLAPSIEPSQRVSSGSASVIPPPKSGSNSATPALVDTPMQDVLDAKDSEKSVSPHARKDRASGLERLPTKSVTVPPTAKSIGKTSGISSSKASTKPATRATEPRPATSSTLPLFVKSSEKITSGTNSTKVSSRTAMYDSEPSCKKPTAVLSKAKAIGKTINDKNSVPPTSNANRNDGARVPESLPARPSTMPPTATSPGKPANGKHIGQSISTKPRKDSTRDSEPAPAKPSATTPKAKSSQNTTNSLNSSKSTTKPAVLSSPDVLIKPMDSAPRRSQPIVPMRRPRENSSSSNVPGMSPVKAASSLPTNSVQPRPNVFTPFSALNSPPRPDYLKEPTTPTRSQEPPKKIRKTILPSDAADKRNKGGKMDIDKNEEEEVANTTDDSESEGEASPAPFNSRDVRRTGVPIPGERRSDRASRPRKHSPGIMSWERVDEATAERDLMWDLFEDDE